MHVNISALLETPILFGAFYGLRRSEALGVRRDAIDFVRNTITIQHTLTSVSLDGKRTTVADGRTKNKASDILPDNFKYFSNLLSYRPRRKALPFRGRYVNRLRYRHC